MPLNERKIINLILEECKNIEERCDGYQNELVNVVTDIITAERQHRVQGTNIQQKINEKCKATGLLLSEKRSQVGTGGEDAS